MKRFILDDVLSKEKIDTRVSIYLEQKRPLRPYTLKLVESNLDKLEENLVSLKFVDYTTKVGMCIDLVSSMYKCLFSRAILKGIVCKIYSGEWNANKAYKTLCQAAGGVFTPKYAEPYRLCLSLITMLIGQPPEGDESPLCTMGVYPIYDKSILSFVSQIDALDSSLKGIQVAHCLGMGMAWLVSSGEVRRKLAHKILKDSSRWRNNLPLLKELENL